MAITSYSELLTAIDSWLDRTDLTSREPEFIALAEASLNRRLRVPDMLSRNTSFTIDSQFENVPSDFLGVEYFQITSSAKDRELEYITPQEMSWKRFDYTSSSEPIYYTVVGGEFEFLPTPDTSYTATLLYYQQIPDLTASNTSNWLLAAHPDIYLFACLLEAEPYLMNDERLAVWGTRLERAINELEILGERTEIGSKATANFRGIGRPNRYRRLS